LTDETSGPPQNPNPENGPILVAVDFAPDSEAAVLWACDFAGCVDAAIVVLHVVHEPADAPGYYRKDEADLLRPMDDVAVDMLDQFLAKMAKTHPDLEALEHAEKVLVKGIPATRIL
jgi:nucleotide-binding universal stress UspA family protein